MDISIWQMAGQTWPGLWRCNREVSQPGA